MITTLASTTHKAMKAVYFPASKLPKPFRDFPIMSTVKLSQKDGRMTVTALTWDEEKQSIGSQVETISARIDQEFETCVPARAFRDWLAASQLTAEEKRRKVSEQITFTFDATRQIVSIKAGNTRAEFKCIDAQEFPATLQ